MYRIALVSFRLFRKNLGNLQEFFGQMVHRHPLAKSARTPMFLGLVIGCFPLYQRTWNFLSGPIRKKKEKIVSEINLNDNYLVRNGYTTRKVLTVSRKFGKMFFYSPLKISGNSILRKIERAPWQNTLLPQCFKVGHHRIVRVAIHKKRGGGRGRRGNLLTSC